MYKGIKPTIAGTIRIAEAETVTAVLVKVKLDGDARFVPGVNHPELPAEEKVIGGDNIEHRRSVLWHLYGAHAAIDRTNEGQVHGLRVEG